jgi:beta-glucanase (GH16 family)
MKWQPVVGAWPAFWLIPVQAATNEGQRESGEIDIFEGQGSQPRMFFGTIHRWSSSHQLESNSPHNRFRLPPATDFAEFHTYGLLWVPGRVTWYFDGVPLHSEQTYEIFDRQDYFLVIGMQEGVDWKEGDQTGVTAQSLRLTVDWVRVWQRATL